MTNNNQYLKIIAEKVTDTTITGNHSDNEYWNMIATVACNKTYTGTVCTGRYVKEVAEVITGESYADFHFNNFYYREIALEYVSTLEDTSDNYLLGVIAENIVLGTTVRVAPVTQSVEYGGSVSVSATVLDMSRQPVTGATVTFKDGSTTLGTGTTDSNGVATYTDSTLSIGTHTITAIYDDVTSNSISVVVTKITPTISLSATDDSVTYGDSISLSGVLSVGSGETIAIYDGDTLIDENITTTTDGAFSKTITSINVGTHNYTAVYVGDSTYSEVTSSICSVSVAKLDTSLDINVPLSLVYSDSFLITGTLEDENNNAITGASVGLKVGDTIVYTDTSDSNGGVSFTTSPVSTGTHTFQLVYLGDSTHETSTSSAVTRNIGKETSVVSVTNPSTSSTTIYSDGAVTISGNLSDDDNTPITNADVLVKKGTTVLATLTTDSDGDFTGSVNGSDLGVGTHTVRVDYPENSNYTGSYIDKTVVVESPTLSLTGSKSVLSYADGESATLTATYTGASVSGRTVSFKVYDGNDNLLETLTGDDTDSNGVATTTFNSHGYGDIYIKAECMSLIQTYSLYDYLFAPTLDSSTSFYQISGSTSISNGEMSGGSARLLSAWDNTVDWELTFQAKKSGSNCGVWIIDSSDTSRDTDCVKLVQLSTPYAYVNGSDTHNYGDLGALSNNTYYSYTITKQNGVLKIKREGSSTELTVNWSLLSSLTSMAIGVDTWGHTATIKDIVVKPL